MNLKKLYENSKLERTEIDPGDWISLLEGYRTDIETINATLAISEKDFILNIVNNLPKQYNSILDSLENQLGETGNNALTFEIIQEKLGNRFACNKKQEDDGVNKSHNNHEEAFVAYLNQFKGSCSSCGKYGHQSKYCPDKQKGKFPQGKSCLFCDQKVHSMFTCKEFKAAKSKNEEANFACDLEESDNQSLNELAF